MEVNGTEDTFDLLGSNWLLHVMSRVGMGQYEIVTVW